MDKAQPITSNFDEDQYTQAMSEGNLVDAVDSGASVLDVEELVAEVLAEAGLSCTVTIEEK